jgi:hypothetical protein
MKHVLSKERSHEDAWGGGGGSAGMPPHILNLLHYTGWNK